MLRVRIVLAALASLAGCATQPVPLAEAARVPPDRVHTTKWAAPGNGTGTLVMKRDSGFTSGGCNFTVSVGGTEVVTLAPGEAHTIYPPAGQLLVGARPKAALCAGGLMETVVVMQPGQVEAVRISIDIASGARLQRSAP